MSDSDLKDEQGEKAGVKKKKAESSIAAENQQRLKGEHRDSKGRQSYQHSEEHQQRSWVSTEESEGQTTTNRVKDEFSCDEGNRAGSEFSHEAQRGAEATATERRTSCDEGEAKEKQIATSFEEAVERLSSINADLQSGKLPLEEALEKYEEAIQLREYATEALAGAKVRIAVAGEKKNVAAFRMQLSAVLSEFEEGIVGAFREKREFPEEEFKNLFSKIQNLINLSIL